MYIYINNRWEFSSRIGENDLQKNSEIFECLAIKNYKKFYRSNAPVSVIQIPDYLWFCQLVMWKFANYLSLIYLLT